MQKKRYYPPAEEQQGQQQNPISTPNPTGVLQTNPNNVANVTQFNPVQQQTPFGQTGVTSPFPQPVQNNAYPQSYDQTQANPVTTGPPTLDGPTYGSVAPPPFSPTQSHSNVVTKHKHVFALDPEGSYTPDQIAQGFGQMNLGNQQPNTPMHPGQSAQHQSPQQQQQNFSTEPGFDPSTVLPQQQCPPIYQRMSLNSVPDTSNLLNKCSIPFGAVIHPMAEATNPEDRIPVVNFGVSGIVRCRRCRAYINPFVTFVDGGRRWRCNLCTLPNDVPSDYYSPIDRNGKRSDLNDRPELVRGCVEYVAPSEYMVRPPQPPTYVFLLDVSYYSITSGMFHTAIKTIQSLLPHFPGDSRTRVAFITFDNTVHFYNLKASLSQPQMLVVTDIQDVFLPLPDDLLVNLQESKQVIETLLNKLPTMFQSTQVVDSVLGVALKAGYALAKNIGGKLITFSSVLPTLGTGKLVNREDLKLLGTDKETQLLLPDVTFYKEFALDCSRQQITVDLFAFSSQYCDLATLGCMPQFTGGQLYYYPSFKYDRDGERFARDLWRNVTRETGWEGVMRVRTSKGLKVTAYYGNFFIRSTDLLALPSIDTDKGFGVQFAHSDSNIGAKYASFQTALLYTTSGGERRIRVFTNCLGVTNSMAEVFKSADIEATTAVIAKMAIEKALSSKLADAREALVNKTIDILSVYRSDVVPPNAASTQLSLPESLKLLPLYVMALGKNIVLRGTADVRPDDRTYVMMLARYLPYGLLLNYIYPRFYSLHNLAPEAGTQDERGVTVLPPQLNLSSEKLERNGVFLLEDGQTIYLYFGREAAPELVNAILGIPSLEGLDTTQIVLPLLDNEYSRRINNIVGYIRSQRATYQPLYVIREGEPRELKFFAHLVEDKTKNVQSYYEFLISIHQKVQAKLKR